MHLLVLFVCISAVAVSADICQSGGNPGLSLSGGGIATIPSGTSATSPYHTHDSVSGKIGELQGSLAGTTDYANIELALGTVPSPKLDFVLQCDPAATATTTYTLTLTHLGTQTGLATVTCGGPGAQIVSSLQANDGMNNVLSISSSLNPASYSVSFCTESGGFDVEVLGDPHFVGFYGQKFDFQGHGNTTYNLYSDTSFSLSSSFAAAKTYGTFMSAYGLLLGSTSVTWQLQVNEQTEKDWLAGYAQSPKFVPTLPSITVSINGTAQVIAKNGKIQMACGAISFSGNQISLTYGGYALATPIRFKPIGREDPTRIAYFDIKKFSVPASAQTKRQGGILGYTLTPGWPRSKSNDLVEKVFTVPALLSTSCKACATPTILICVSSSTGRSASVAVTPVPLK